MSKQKFGLTIPMYSGVFGFVRLVKTFQDSILSAVSSFLLLSISPMTSLLDFFPLLLNNGPPSNGLNFQSWLHSAYHLKLQVFICVRI